MRVLLTNITLQGVSGTETATRDLALGLLRAGHQVMVYSSNLGPIAQEIREAGAEVSDDLAAFSTMPDMIHGHHHMETVAALSRFPAVPAIFVMHDAHAWHDIPPLVPQIKRYACVSRITQSRLERYGVKKEATRIILNSFDPARFLQRRRIQARPAKALYFCSYVNGHASLAPLRAACEQEGISLDVIGKGLNRMEAKPEAMLGEYDLVFATGRCAIEAAATGAAVILFGSSGLGCMLTPQNIAGMRQANLGMTLLTREPEKEAIAAEIRKYDAAATLALCRYIRENASLEGAVREYLALYQEAADEPGLPAPDPAREALHAMAVQTARMENWCMQEFPSTPLPDNIGGRISLRIVQCPETVLSTFSAEVELENRGEEMLISNAPFPVFFSYHWYNRRGRCVKFSGHKTRIPRAILPGEKKRAFVAVNPPPGEGSYSLRITLMQEGTFWFDELKTPVMAETRVKRLAGEQTAKPHGLKSAARRIWKALISSIAFLNLLVSALESAFSQAAECLP